MAYFHASVTSEVSATTNLFFLIIKQTKYLPEVFVFWLLSCCRGTQSTLILKKKKFFTYSKRFSWGISTLKKTKSNFFKKKQLILPYSCDNFLLWSILVVRTMWGDSVTPLVIDPDYSFWNAKWILPTLLRDRCKWKIAIRKYYNPPFRTILALSVFHLYPKLKEFLGRNAWQIC